MSPRIPARFLAMVLSFVLLQCRQTTDPEPPSRPPQGQGTLIPGPDLHRPRMGSEFVPADSVSPIPQMGGGSQTETLTGFALSPAGERLPGIRVKLFPSGYDPSQPDTSALRQVVTDDSGRFAFPRLDTSAYYNLIAGQPDLRLWAYAESLQTRSGDLGDRPLTLGLASTLLVDLHTSTTYVTRDSGIAYYPGTDILARCDGRTTARVDSIPSGLQGLILRSKSGWQHQVDIPQNADSVLVTANATDVSIRYLPQ